MEGNAPVSDQDSLSLSLTPPLSLDRAPAVPESGSRTPQNDSDSISEHIENDRSLGEIEVEPLDLFSMENPQQDQELSQEPKPPSFNSSFSSSSIISLNALDKFVADESKDNIKSILEEILNNDQFRSDSNEESLNIFANVDLDDKLLNSYNLGRNRSLDSSMDRRLKDFEELILVKDETIAALNSELDSFRELMSNPSSNSLGTSTTEYKQFQDECHNKIIEYHTALVHKDELIQKLTESLHQSILSREELKQQTDHFKSEISLLQKQLEDTSDLLKKTKKTEDCSFDIECSKFEGALELPQKAMFNELKVVFNVYVQDKVNARRKSYENEISNLKLKMEKDKEEQEQEISRLRELVSKVDCSSSEIVQLKRELDEKHSQEMEELRTYFEKKCADLEKNYSEEVFSQQSRRLSGSSSCDSELSSDLFPPMQQPGPGGDTKAEYSKKDVSKLKTDLAQMLEILGKYDLNKLSDEEFEALKTEIRKFDLRNLMKYDLVAIKNELQNKYHAELEILREDFDNRIDHLNVEHQEKLKELGVRYSEEMEDLRVEESRSTCAVQQEVVSSGEFEIDEVVQSYERRLQEQVTLAKLDIIGALEKQIQRLASNECADEEWPEELLVLRDRFCERHKVEVARLQEEYEAEITRLKDEHVKTLNGALERARRRSLRDADSLNKGELELIKERDSLKKQVSHLRNLLGELCKYCIECEDELNNTLVEELLRLGLYKSLEMSGNSKLELSSSSSDGSKRVHLAPNFEDLIHLIDCSAENDESIDLKGELGLCLEKLKADANAVLALTTNNRLELEVVEDEKQDEKRKFGAEDKENKWEFRDVPALESKITSLTRQLISETQAKNELSEELNEVRGVAESSEIERGNLEEQLERVLDRQKVVEGDLMCARQKIAELIENGHKEIVSEGYGEHGRKGVKGMVDAIAILAELQERARSVTEHPKNVDPVLLHLIEDLARAGEKIVEEAKREQDDFTQQIEAADKKYRVTCQFLEDQAAEREQERDESQRRIDALNQQLRDRDKDRASCERYTSEVEHLEQQLREMTKALADAERRCELVEADRKEAVEKVSDLRAIIRDLEQQVETKTSTEEELRHMVGELENIVELQVKSANTRKNNQLETSNVEELRQHIGELETEVQGLRLNAELAGSEGTVQQIKNLLHEFEATLDKRTKELEMLHSAVSTNSCSSPSEDMSIRDVVQMSVVYDECEVPLQQLARLKEKLVRHSRAEDAALKRIRDLEMQVFTIKTDLEESQSEKDILKRQISDQLVLISSLQIRLDDQRIRAEHIEKQTNTSLEVRIYDLQNVIASLEEKIMLRDKTINKLNGIVEETSKRLKAQEDELTSHKEDAMIIEMQEELEHLRKIVPSVKQIETLREELNQSNRLLKKFKDLGLSDSEIEILHELLVSGYSIREISEMRATASVSEDVSEAIKPQLFNDSTVELSAIVSSSVQKTQSLPSSNSTMKHVRFEDQELLKKDAIIEEYEERLKKLSELEQKVAKLEKALELTEVELNKATSEVVASEALKSEVDRLKLELEAKRTEIDELKNSGMELRKDLKSREEEKKQIENLNAQLKADIDNYQFDMKTFESERNKYESQLKLNQGEIGRLEEQLKNLRNTQTCLEMKDKELNHLNQLLAEKEKINARMTEDYKSIHNDLLTLQAKVLETGNIVDLSRKLREEQKKNADLIDEMYAMKAHCFDDRRSMDDIEAQVQKQLEVSQMLDESLANALSDPGSAEDIDALQILVRKQKSVNKQLSKAKEQLQTKFEELELQHENLLNECGKLSNQLDKEKRAFKTLQMEDTLLIEGLRKKLEETLNRELEYQKQLDEEKSRKLSSESSTQYKSLPNPVEQQLKALEEHKKELEHKVRKLRQQNTQLESQLKYTDSVLAAKNEEIKKLDGRLDSMREIEDKLRAQLVKYKADIDLKTCQLEEARNLLGDLDNDCRDLKRTNEALTEKLSLLSKTLEKKKTKPQMIEIGTQTSEKFVSEEVVRKIKELNLAARDNLHMLELLTRLTNEKAVLEDRIVALEHQNTHDLPFDDPTSRANYLMAKYLRMNSYRKALVFQKAYLTSLLASYQGQGQMSVKYVHINFSKRKSRSSGKERFRRVGWALVALSRMNYMVRRWRSGKRIVQQRGAVQVTRSAQFHVGQPVSSQAFNSNREAVPTSALPHNEIALPAFGDSPPSKDTKFSRQEALRSPGLLSKYVDRFNQIQEKLERNLAVSSNPRS